MECIWHDNQKHFRGKTIDSQETCLAHVATDGDEPERQTQPKHRRSNKTTKTIQQNIAADRFPKKIAYGPTPKTGSSMGFTKAPFPHVQ